MKEPIKYLVVSILITFICLLVGVGIGFLIFKEDEKSTTPSKDMTEEIEKLIQPEREKIDSLTLEIQGKEEIINRLRDSLKNMEVTRIYKVDSIRKLPTTEGVEFLRNKLREFESKYQKE